MDPITTQHANCWKGRMHHTHYIFIMNMIKQKKKLKWNKKGVTMKHTVSS